LLDPIAGLIYLGLQFGIGALYVSAILKQLEYALVFIERGFCEDPSADPETAQQLSIQLG
jgi:hypothetical protein